MHQRQPDHDGRRNRPPLLLAALLLVAAAACGDDLTAPPASCELEDRDRSAHCQGSCKSDSPPTELCPGADAAACFAACYACDVDDGAWCPAGGGQ